jgi:hypothetical protein
MKVVYRCDDGEQNSFVLVHNRDGKIIRRTDLVLDRWEVVTDEEALRGFRRRFYERDRLTTERAVNMDKVKESCKCGDPFSSHNRDIHGTSSARVDEALLGKKAYDIFSDRPAGESGCTECDCSQWKPATY